MNNIEPSTIFIEKGVLYISDERLTNRLIQVFPRDGEMKSISLLHLWEMRVNESNLSSLFLHLDCFEGDEVVTIEFDPSQFDLIKTNLDLHSMGILEDYNPLTGDAKRVLFITDMNEGLKDLFFI